MTKLVIIFEASEQFNAGETLACFKKNQVALKTELQNMRNKRGQLLEK